MPSQRRLHAGAVLFLSERQPHECTAIRASVGGPRFCRSGYPAHLFRGRVGLPHFRQENLPGSGGGGHPSPEGRLARNLWRRLLSLDYVLEHPGLRWLPTEQEKVGCFEALGLDRRLLPRRVYRGTVREAETLLRAEVSVAVDAETATFAFVDPGHGTDTGLRTWGEAHWALASATGKGFRGPRGRHRQGPSSGDAGKNGAAKLGQWRGQGNSVDPSIAEELKLIERAVGKNNQDVLRKYGGLNHAIQRHITLGKLPPSKRRPEARLTATRPGGRAVSAKSMRGCKQQVSKVEVDRGLLIHFRKVSIHFRLLQGQKGGCNKNPP